MEPIRARYAGVCARTGKPYRAGDLIVKLSSGKWAIAQDKAGNTKTAPVQPVWQLCITPNGKEKTLNINALIVCGECWNEDGNEGKTPSEAEKLPYAFTRSGGAPSPLSQKQIRTPEPTPPCGPICTS